MKQNRIERVTYLVKWVLLMFCSFKSLFYFYIFFLKFRENKLLGFRVCFDYTFGYTIASNKMYMV